MPAAPFTLAPPKLFPLAELVARRAAHAARGERVVLTNGCFDLLHAGHLHFLQAARAAGDVLFIALNNDASVRTLKGPHRPVQSEQERAYALGALACTDALCLFGGARLDAEIRALRPDLYVKAGDYRLETLDPTERAALEAAGTEIRFLPFLPGFSSTDLIRRISAAAGPA